MHVINFNNGTGTDVTVQSIEGAFEIGGGNDDLNRQYWSGETPVSRNGIARNGRCLVEAEDQSAHSQTMMVLLGLDSPVGEGEYTVTIDGTVYAYAALVDTHLQGDGIQVVEISWKGTVDPSLGPG